MDDLSIFFKFPGKFLLSPNRIVMIVAILDHQCDLLRRLMTFTQRTTFGWWENFFCSFSFLFLSGKTSDIRNFVFCFVFRSLDFRFIDKLPVQRKRPHTANSTNLQTKKVIFYACKSAEHTKYIRIFSIRFQYFFHFFTFIYSDMPPAFIYSLLFILLWKCYRSQIYKRYCFQSHRLNDNCVWFFGKSDGLVTL